MNDRVFSKENNLKKSSRDTSMDIVKGLTMFLVILGHMGFSWVATFHMALFFVISGYFLSEKQDINPFILKKARQLLIPYLAGCLLTIIGSVFINVLLGQYSEIVPDIKMWFIASLYGKGSKRDFLIPGIHKIGALWFILAVFYASVIARYFLSSKYAFIITAIIAYIGLSTRNVLFLPFSLQNGMVASFFSGIGIYHKKWRPLERG